jgi:hypothetical protein
VTSVGLKKTATRLAALLTSFVIGITTYNVGQTPVVISDIPSAAAKREDDLHRLYEAAMLSGDSGLRYGITFRLACVNPNDSLEIRFVQIRPSLECQKAREDSESGLSTLLKSHAHWARQNMPFIREISTAEKARAYVIAHLE